MGSRTAASESLLAHATSERRNLSSHRFAHNQIWCELVAMASKLTAWTLTLILDAAAFLHGITRA